MATLDDPRWLCVDPGETTGWSIWKGDRVLGGGQTPMWEFADDVWEALFEEDGLLLNVDETSRGDAEAHLNEGGIDFIVCEKFALYPWEAHNLAFDEFRTVQLIGALTMMARRSDIPIYKQPATIKQPALAAGADEMFLHPLYENRHQNDSIMHGWFYVMVEMKGARLIVPDGTKPRAE